MTAVQVNNDGYGHSSFSRCDGYYKQGEEQTVHLPGPQVFIKGDKIQVYAVQDELYTHQHGDKVSPGEETIHADEKQRSTDE